MNTKRTNPSCRPCTTDAMERLAAENEALRDERDELQVKYEANTAILNVRTKAMNDLSAKIERLREASEQVSMAAEYGDVANALHMAPSVHWLLTVADETPTQSLAHIRAAGAREALERATKAPRFSGTVVRVDLMREIIEQMEGEV